MDSQTEKEVTEKVLTKNEETYSRRWESDGEGTRTEKRLSESEELQTEKGLTNGEGTDRQRRDSQMEMGLKTEKGLRLGRDSQTATVFLAPTFCSERKDAIEKGKKVRRGSEKEQRHLGAPSCNTDDYGMLNIEQCNNIGA